MSQYEHTGEKACSKASWIQRCTRPTHLPPMVLCPIPLEVSALETHQPCTTQLDSVITHWHISWGLGKLSSGAQNVHCPSSPNPGCSPKELDLGKEKLCSFCIRRRGDLKGLKLRADITRRPAICRHTRPPGHAWPTKMCRTEVVYWKPSHTPLCHHSYRVKAVACLDNCLVPPFHFLELYM